MCGQEETFYKVRKCLLERKEPLLRKQANITPRVQETNI